MPEEKFHGFGNTCGLAFPFFGSSLSLSQSRLISWIVICWRNCLFLQHHCRSRGSALFHLYTLSTSWFCVFFISTSLSSLPCRGSGLLNKKKVSFKFALDTVARKRGQQLYSSKHEWKTSMYCRVPPRWLRKVEDSTAWFSCYTVKHNHLVWPKTVPWKRLQMITWVFQTFSTMARHKIIWKCY